MYRPTFRPTKFKFHCVAPQFFIFQQTVQIALNFIHSNAHIFLFGLIPWVIPNYITSQTILRLLPIPVRLLLTPLYLPVQVVPPYSLLLFFSSCPEQRNTSHQIAHNRLHCHRWIKLKHYNHLQEGRKCFI